MLNIPHLTRCFVVGLLVLGLYLAVENTLISAEVLATMSGASVVSATAIAVGATALELTFASWIRSEQGMKELLTSIARKPLVTLPRMFALGIGLALTYHFDILTTAAHPRFNTDNAYFFTVVVMAFVFGPEACIVIASWLWFKARDVETRQLQQNTIRDAENAKMKRQKSTLVGLAEQAGEEEAIQIARSRWGDRNGSQPTSV